MLLEKVENPKNILANIDDAGVKNLIEKLGLKDQVTLVSTSGKTADADVTLKKAQKSHQRGGLVLWCTKDQRSFTISTSLIGEHNLANSCQVLACLLRLEDEKIIAKLESEKVEKAFSSFAGVSRRLDHLSTVNGIEIYEDFAHHPTSVAKVIESFKSSHPEKSLVVAFEPRNATSRRNVFTKQFAESLQKADRVLIGHCQLIREFQQKRMNTKELAKLIGVERLEPTKTTKV